MFKIECKISKKGNKFLVLTYNGIYITFDMRVIEKIAMENDVSNIDLYHLDEGENIIIK